MGHRTDQPPEQPSPAAQPWPEGVTHRYANLVGATVDITGSGPVSEQQSAQRTCTSCRGAKGRTVDTSHDGKTIQTWQPCGPCHGTGVQGGGI